MKAGLASMHNWMDIELLPDNKIKRLYLDLLDFKQKYKL